VRTVSTAPEIHPAVALYAPDAVMARPDGSLVSTEVARRQPDGGWLYVLKYPFARRDRTRWLSLGQRRHRAATTESR
jgi:hypothetical protein